MDKNAQHPSLVAIGQALKSANKAATLFFGQLPAANADEYPLAINVKEALALAQGRKIRTREGYEAQIRDLQCLSSLEKEVEAARKSITTHIDAAKKNAQGFFKPMLDYIEEARAMEKAAVEEYLLKEEAKQQQKLARQSKAAQDLHEKADRAFEQGDTELAITLRTKATAKSAEGEILAKVEGISTSTSYQVEVFDAFALIQAVARGEVSREALAVNETWLARQARQLKQDFAYPGVRLKTGKRIAVKAA